MAKFYRFDEAFLSRIREDVDLAELVSREIKLKRAGRNFVALCPFHKENSPSFRVKPETNTYKCYGCPASGDVISWMMQRHHLKFPEAVVRLAEENRIELPPPESDSPDDQERRRRLAKLYNVLKDAARIYHSGLERNVAARAYLVGERGLSDATIAEFGLGAVTSGIIRLLARSGDDLLIAAGLAVQGERGLYDRFRDRIIFPIENESGSIVGFAGRTMLPSNGKTPKYLNTAETEIFHKGKELYGLSKAKMAIRKARLAVVVEGYLDVLRAHQEGDKRVVAPMGTAITEHQVKRLLVQTDHLVFAFDGDRAGRRAALAAAAVLLGELKDGQTAQFLFLPEGEDPDTFIRDQGIAAWEEALKGARTLSAFLSDYVTHRLDRTIPERQVVAANKAKAVLAKVSKALIYRHALRLLFEDLIGVPLS
ncbi:DNA primase [Pseudomonas siliginis]|uniref:DNA primase n=1 Tax=Pseudomonas siliginis TaxID=2842346 RepID=UPI002093F9F8|nr:DNA primase [Pseudomonas siliginis]UST77187.1 DNA primase [Pseudomonas siliginis]